MDGVHLGTGRQIHYFVENSLGQDESADHGWEYCDRSVLGRMREGLSGLAGSVDHGVRHHKEKEGEGAAAAERMSKRVVATHSRYGSEHMEEVAALGEVSFAVASVRCRCIPFSAAWVLDPSIPSLSPKKAICSISSTKVSPNMRAPRLFLAKAVNPTQSCGMYNLA